MADYGEKEFAAAVDRDRSGADLSETIRQRDGLARELAEVKSKLQALYDQGLFAGFLDLDGTVLDANRSCLEMCGFTRADVIGKLFWDCGWWNRSTDLQANVRQAVESGARGETFRRESRYFVADGGERFVELAIMPIRDDAGKIVNLMATGMDITQRRLADQERRETEIHRESEARFRQLAETMPQMAWMARPDGWLFWYNQRWFQYTGTTAKDMEGWGWQRVHDPEMLPKVMDRWQQSIDTGEPFDMTFPIRSASGEFRSFLTRVMPLRDSDGKIVLWFGTNTDVTEQEHAAKSLREGKQQLAIALEAGRLGTWELDLQAMELTCSDGCKANFGLPPGDPATQEALWDAVNVEDRNAAQDIVWRAVERREDYSIEYRVTWPDGSLHWISARGHPVFDEQGDVLRFIGVTQDITARKQNEEQREQLLQAERAARTEAERVARMKDEFLATLSHELRTPLNSILGWSQLMQGGKGDPREIAQGLEVIERNARAQAQIIEDLLDMSRIVSGKVRLDVQRVDVAGIVKSAVETARPAAEGKGVRLISIIDPLENVVVNGDANRLGQVLWNLLSNATKFTPRGGQIQVVLERVNSHIEMSVIDSGEGIKPEFLPYVFDRFRQADASTTRRHGGLGLGLSIVKQLVELHGGTVRARSAGAGMGSTFVVALPLTVLHPEEEKDEQRRHPRVAPIGAGIPETCVEIGGLRVLVVDDEPDARELLSRLLKECDAIVATAGSAQEAMTLLQGGTFDVLVSDIGMPGEDGYALIRRVRGLGKGAGGDIPAIALTAYARAEDRVKAIASGFRMHLAKPVEPVELITMVAAAAGRTGQASPGNVAKE